MLTPTVDKNELEDLMDLVSNDMTTDEAYVCRKTGKIHWIPDFAISGIEVDVPADIDDQIKYVSVPDKRDLDLGSSLAYDFAGQHLPIQYEQVRDMFWRAGAYGRFKGLLEGKDLLQAWYDFEAEQTTKALAQWCKDEGLELSA
ncbi:MAG: hypothetical protein DRR11_20950 [Gammaproteobacteria bacterium]|nr:MAG: hypothetical protein DRR11_20950 [Gammaproteobacteria bacterium]